MKVFIITVCRNAESLIESTVKSVLSQTYQDKQYIIIDGASTDCTLEIVKKYATEYLNASSSLDGKPLYISEPDKGIYDAMNKGLKIARDYVSKLSDKNQDATESLAWVNFMNAGDTFADDKVLEDIFGIVSKYNIPDTVRVIGGNTINFFADGHKEIHHAEDSSAIPQRIPFSHQATMARLSSDYLWSFDTKYRYAADYNFLNQTFWQFGADSILTIDRAIAQYRQEDSASLTNANQTKGEYLSIQAAHRTWRWWKEYLKWRLF